MAFAVQSALLLGFAVLAMVADLVAAGGYGPTCSAGCFAVAGRKFKIQNRPQDNGGFVCPEGVPSSTVTFCNGPGKNVKIFGNFGAVGLGMCDPAINPETLTAADVVTYEQYGDTVVIRRKGSVPSVFRGYVIQGKKIALGISGGFFDVSTLTDVGPAKC